MSNMRNWTQCIATVDIRVSMDVTPTDFVDKWYLPIAELLTLPKPPRRTSEMRTE
jgi:hypothetical protein